MRATRHRVRSTILAILLAACGPSPAPATPRSRDDPSSPLPIEAHLLLGDELFDRNELASARSHYQQVAFAATNELAWYARYRIAWCDYDAGDREHAMDELVVVARSPASDRLVSTARADLVRMLVALDPPPGQDEVRMRITLAADPDIAAKMLETYRKLRASGARQQK